MIHHNKLQIVTYRGGTTLFPENSIEAIAASIKSNPQIIIEIDVQLTKDKEVVAFHDFHLNDLTNGKGLVKAHTINELKKLSLRNPDGSLHAEARIATLEEMFQTFPDQPFVLDLHENNKILFDKVIEIVERNKRATQIVLVSIAKGAIAELQKLRPQWTFVASPAETRKFIFASMLFLDKFVRVTANIMFLPEKLGAIKILRKRAIQTLHSRNIKVWTCVNFKPYQNVNAFADLERLKEFGVDGVYTDDPACLQPTR